MSDSPPTTIPSLLTTGIPGFDEVLKGGVTPNRLYLIEGNPGSGKTTLAIRYLLEGVGRGDRGLYVTLSETKEELEAVIRSHGWPEHQFDIFELMPSEESLAADSQVRMFHPSEVELNETTRKILAEVERIKPKRVVFDSLSEMRLLAQNSLRYRRQILALKQFFTGRDCTVLLLDDRSSDENDLQLHSLAHGVITLEQLSPEYGAERRRLKVVKHRGRDFLGGFHDFRIAKGGLTVFPRLVAADHPRGFESAQMSSGLDALDALVGGGLDRGTSSLLLGPAGSGKSSISILYAHAAAQRGEHATVFTFDESIATIIARSAGLGIDIRGDIEAGLLTVQAVDPSEMAPGEFAHAVLEAAENGASVVVIDSINGYLNAMPEERFLVLHLREMLNFLGNQGVLTFLVVAQHGLLGSNMISPVDASYLADSVILLRYFEAAGEVRRAISVIKKRGGVHERTLREMSMEGGRIHIGEPLYGFHGVLTGTPAFLENPAPGQGPVDE